MPDRLGEDDPAGRGNQEQDLTFTEPTKNIAYLCSSNEEIVCF